MKIKPILFTLFIIIIIMSLIFLSGCDSYDYLMSKIIKGDSSNESYDDGEVKAVDEAIAAAEKEIEAEKLEGTAEKSEKDIDASITESEKPFEEQDKLPDEPITYYATIWDAISIALVINFKAAEVSGSLSQSGDTYRDAGIVGTIDIETFEVNSTFSGIQGLNITARNILLMGL